MMDTWLMIGFILLLLEILMPSLVWGSFSVSCFLAYLTGYVYPSVWIEGFIFIASSLLLIAFGLPLLGHYLLVPKKKEKHHD